MHGDASRFPNRHQTGDDRIRIAVLLRQHFAVIIGRNTAHIVMHGRQYGYRLLRHIDARENLGAFRDAGKPLVQNLRVEMVKMQIDVILLLADAAAFANFHRHRARNDVTRGKVFGGWRITLHKTLAFGIGEISAFAARAFSNQAARAINTGGVELHKFHVLQRQAGTEHHRIAIPRAGMRRRRREIGAAIAAGRQNHFGCTEAMDRAIIHFQRHQPDATAFLIHDQIKREILDEELGLRAQGLPIKRMQNGVAGAVGGGAGALRGSFTKFCRHAAERPLINLAFLRPRKRHAPMLQLIDGFGRVAAEIFNRVLVAEPVGTLHRVIHMPAPIVAAHIAERRRNAALGRNRMRARWKHFRNARGAKARLRAANSRAKARTSGAYDNDIKGVIGNWVSLAVLSGGRTSHFYAPNVNLRTANTHAAPTASENKVFNASAIIFDPSPWI